MAVDSGTFSDYVRGLAGSVSLDHLMVVVPTSGEATQIPVGEFLSQSLVTAGLFRTAQTALPIINGTVMIQNYEVGMMSATFQAAGGAVNKGTGVITLPSTGGFAAEAALWRVTLYQDFSGLTTKDEVVRFVITGNTDGTDIFHSAFISNNQSEVSNNLVYYWIPPIGEQLTFGVNADAAQAGADLEKCTFSFELIGVPSDLIIS